MNRYRPLLLAGAALLAACAAAPTPAAAQSDDFQTWAMVAVNASFGSKYRGYFELQPRFDDDSRRAQALLVRTAFGYAVRPNVSVWLGYAPITFYQPTRVFENRVFQQLLVQSAFPKFDMLNRTRLEQRFLDNGADTSWRVRHQVRAVFPIDRQRKWSVVAQEELFVNLNDASAGIQSGYDQNRAFVGVSTKVSPTARVEVGYQWVNVRVPTAAPDRDLHVLLTNVFLNL